MTKKIVPDTSVIIDGRISEIIGGKKGEIEILIPEAVVAELEHQANLGKEIGFEGLAELKSLTATKEAKVEFVGEYPTSKSLRNMDEIIRRTAQEFDAILITSDKVQALVAEARGLKVKYLEPKVKVKKPKVLDLFDDKTMSIHLKEGTPVYAKKGHVGSFDLVKIVPNIDREKLNGYVKELVEFTHADPKSYMEMEERGATVIQLREHRIVIARPPFSDGLELTIVRPIARTKLADYSLSDKLIKRLESHAEGIFVAGPPGAGKTTFVQALAEFYRSKSKIIKTMEHPRDLQLPDDITQYSSLGGSMEKTGDILLLVRPDYTIFDEMRKTNDFMVFADMRLAGIGLVGVTHASRAIDAIQRLVGRVELGVIPHIVDTVIFLRAGGVSDVYDLRMTVKVPHGMTESDLARPIIEVRDFETGVPVFEMYSYGEEVVVIPIRTKQKRDSLLEISKTKKHVILRSMAHKNEHVKVFAGNRYIFTGKMNRSGNIKVRRNSEPGRILFAALGNGEQIRLGK